MRLRKCLLLFLGIQKNGGSIALGIYKKAVARAKKLPFIDNYRKDKDCHFFVLLNIFSVSLAFFPRPCYNIKDIVYAKKPMLPNSKPNSKEMKNL